MYVFACLPLFHYVTIIVNVTFNLKQFAIKDITTASDSSILTFIFPLKFHIIYNHFNWLSTWVILFQSPLISPLLMHFTSAETACGLQFGNKTQHRLLNDIMPSSVLSWKLSRPYFNMKYSTLVFSSHSNNS